MYQETVVNSRPDREIRKKVVTPGDYNVVPYEESRCKIVFSEVICKNGSGPCDLDPESRFFSKSFDGNVLIGSADYFLDRDIELILQQMCCGETCLASLVYRDEDGAIAQEISCKIQLVDVTEEQLISDWGWVRLYEAATYHKGEGVELVKKKKIFEAFRRFSKSLKMLIAIEPIDPEVISEEIVKEMVDLKVKLYNNLAHCQLYYDEYEAALQLCNKALSFQTDNPKALYRRCVAYTNLKMYEEAWKDIQQVLKLDPNDKAAQQRADILKTKVEKINVDYKSVIKNMFKNY